MKNRRIKGLLASLFALAMAVSVGTSLSFAKAQKHPEIVLAEGEEDPETPVSSEDDEEPASSEETPASSEEAAPAEESSESASEEQQAASLPKISGKDILKLIFQAFKDAIKDLIRHLDKWFAN